MASGLSADDAMTLAVEETRRFRKEKLASKRKPENDRHSDH